MMASEHEKVSPDRQGVASMSLLVRLARAADPRRSLRARLLLAVLAALLVPGSVFVVLLSSRLSDLENGGFRRGLILAFVFLIAATLAALLFVARRLAGPIEDLVRAAEEIGQGRPVALSAPAAQDELGRLAVALNRAARRVDRRVETLRRLHSLLRQEYHAAELPEILARSTEAIAAFTRAERVWFFLHDPQSNRLQAAWPAWNVGEEIAAKVQISVGARSLASQVFRGGEVRIADDLERSPSTDPALIEVGPVSNAIFCPLKTEKETLGVVVATNRPGGFGQEESDALTSFADAASLLIRNARLYASLRGTVEELRRASRLKDHFLQNVNHELRTPLTSIVGWTDLLEEQTVGEETCAGD